MDSNPMAMQTIQSNTIFTNVAKTSDGGVYWEGIDADAVAPGATITSWRNQESWQPGEKNNPAAHPNSRYENVLLSLSMFLRVFYFLSINKEKNFRNKLLPFFFFAYVDNTTF